MREAVSGDRGLRYIGLVQPCWSAFKSVDKRHHRLGLSPATHRSRLSPSRDDRIDEQRTTHSTARLYGADEIAFCALS